MWDRDEIVPGPWGLPGFRVVSLERANDGVESRVRVRLERRGPRRYACGGCGRRTSRVRAARDRTWDDLPCTLHPVTLVYRQRRLVCRRCGVRTERIEFAEPKARVTRHLRQQSGLDCQSMPTSHAAVRHRISWGTARRAATAFLTEWDRTRRKRRPRHIGLDEIQRGKGQHFWTVLSDVVHGEVMGLRRWQPLPEMERLGAFLVRHLDGIAAYCFHPVRFGVVESINTSIKDVMRRARGMRDQHLLLLKLSSFSG